MPKPLNFGLFAILEEQQTRRPKELKSDTSAMEKINGSERLRSAGHSFHFENAQWTITHYLCPIHIFTGIFTILIVNIMQKHLQKNSVKLLVVIA